jgi:uncharacterized protein (TIGR03067 family)
MPTDLERLQGTWTVTSLEMDGQMMDSADGAHIVIKKDAFKSVGMGATYEGVVEIDERKKPKSFDLKFTKGAEKGNRNLGIYKLDDDVWTICLATRGERRPRKFLTESGSGIALETLVRGRPSKTKAKPSSKASALPQNPTDASPTEIEGEWVMVSAVFNGAAMEDSMVKWCKRVTTGNVTTVLAGPQTMLKASFTLQEPNLIDYVNLAGAAKGKAQAGIYQLSGDVLKICMSAPGDPRPTDFASARGDRRSYTVWRRV